MKMSKMQFVGEGQDVTLNAKQVGKMLRKFHGEFLKHNKFLNHKVADLGLAAAKKKDDLEIGELFIGLVAFHTSDNL